MFCVVALVVLSILGIFSASNRELAREAADCVLRRVTLRPCNTGFDEKMKARILGVVITRSEKAARFLNKNFELLAWAFIVLFLASGIWTLRGFYLFYVTGSCNGANNSGFCVFDPTGANNQVSGIDNSGCGLKPGLSKQLTLEGVDVTNFPTENPEASERIVFIGCYACDYTRKVYPEVRAMADQYKVGFVFGEYPVKEKTGEDARVAYCVYQQDQAAFWKLSDAFFAADKADLDSLPYLLEQVDALGIDSKAVGVCLADPNTDMALKAQQDEMLKTNFYGTPTVFIKGQTFVGPKPGRVYAIALRGLFFWLK